VRGDFVLQRGDAIGVGAVWALDGQAAGGARWSRVDVAPTAACLGAAVLLGSLVIETNAAEPTQGGH
jgi:hypothetical protein